MERLTPFVLSLIPLRLLLLLRLARQGAQLLCLELCQLLLPVHLDDERHDEHQERRRRDPRRLARRAGELPRGVGDGGGRGLERGQGELGEGGHVRARASE